MTAMKSIYFKVGGGATDLTLYGMKFSRDQIRCHVTNSRPLKTGKKKRSAKVPSKDQIRKNIKFIVVWFGLTFPPLAIIFA